MRKQGLRRIIQGINKTARKRTSRFMSLHPMPESKEIPNWRKCTTIQPLPMDGT